MISAFVELLRSALRLVFNSRRLYSLVIPFQANSFELAHYHPYRPLLTKEGIKGVVDEVYSIGIFTFFDFATFFAISYPASTCLRMPMPGSLVSTRSILFAISFVPSATVTCPAWIE